jgi:hypothetical protein
MSRGKYSPALNREMIDARDDSYVYNIYSEVAPEWNKDNGEVYDQRKHLGHYDADGYDRYGYSGLDASGNYVGIGEGIDRWGYTEMDYLAMDDEDFNAL